MAENQIIRGGIEGVLSDALEVELPSFGQATTLLRFTPRVSTAPSAADAVIRIQKQSGGAPTDFIQATIVNGALLGVQAAGSISLSAGDTWFLHVVTASGAEWLEVTVIADVANVTGIIDSTFPGVLVDPFEVEIPSVPGVTTIQRIVARVATAPSGGSCVVKIQDGSGAAPPNSITSTISSGSTIGTAGVGSIAVGPSTRLYVRATPTNGAEWLQVELELAPATGAAALDLTTLACVKDEANISGTTLDALIATLISAVSAEMTRYMQRQIAPVSYTSERFDGEGENWFEVKHPPIRALTAINLEGDLGVYSEAVTLAGTKRDDVAGVVWIGADGFQDLDLVTLLGAHIGEVTYDGGFPVVPLDIAQKACLQVIHELNQTDRRGGRLGLQQKVLDSGGTSTYVVGKWAPGVRETLDAYRTEL